ncbi:hypothetical protein J2R87_001966 [Bradyrhizobium elkanii]|nr:hypothetical protein [Bradyrhizobium elkanii]
MAAQDTIHVALGEAGIPDRLETRIGGKCERAPAGYFSGGRHSDAYDRDFAANRVVVGPFRHAFKS